MILYDTWNVFNLHIILFFLFHTLKSIFLLFFSQFIDFIYISTIKTEFYFICFLYFFAKDIVMDFFPFWASNLDQTFTFRAFLGVKIYSPD